MQQPMNYARPQAGYGQTPRLYSGSATSNGTDEQATTNTSSTTQQAASPRLFSSDANTLNLGTDPNTVQQDPNTDGSYNPYSYDTQQQYGPYGQQTGYATYQAPQAYSQ